MAGQVRLHQGIVGLVPILQKGAAARIVEAVRYPLISGMNEDQLQQALELLTNELLHSSFFGTRLAASELSTIEDQFKRFMTALAMLRDKEFPPPPPPSAWINAFKCWVRSEGRALVHYRVGGRPASDWDYTAYPRLLGIYEYAFGRPASPNNMAGPTARFVRAYLTEASAQIKRAGFLSGSEASRVSQIWAVPLPDALKKKLVAAKPRIKKWGDIYLGSVRREVRNQAGNS